eukprot:767436-Hanusia_phi.AAC.14
MRSSVSSQTLTGGQQRARTLLEKARMQAGTERVWMKSVILERDQGNMKAACELLAQALEKYPTFAKLWMMLIQVRPLPC